MGELQKQIAQVIAGDLRQMEALLLAQAHTLNAVFGRLIRAGMPSDGRSLHQCEVLLRTALRAQSQCRATVATLGELKNPSQVSFIRQANVGQAVQVNNGVGLDGSRARERGLVPNELLEIDNGKRLDSGTARSTGVARQAMEAVAAINRTADGQG